MKKIAIIALMFNLVLAGSFYYKLNKSYQVVDQIIYKRQDKESLKIEEYLIGVVACEMPASFHEEALKAQAVSARTYLYNELSKPNNIIAIRNVIVYTVARYLLSVNTL